MFATLVILVMAMLVDLEVHGSPIPEERDELSLIAPPLIEV
jgi:hypothetical protein